MKSSRTCAVSSETVVSDVGEYDLALADVNNVELLPTSWIQYTLYVLNLFSPFWLLDNVHP